MCPKLKLSVCLSAYVLEIRHVFEEAEGRWCAGVTARGWAFLLLGGNLQKSKHSMAAAGSSTPPTDIADDTEEQLVIESLLWTCKEYIPKPPTLYIVTHAFCWRCAFCVPNSAGATSTRFRR